MIGRRRSVCAELGIADVVDRDQATRLVLDLARDVAHDVARPAAPLTTFLVGLAAGRADNPMSAAPACAQRVVRQGVARG